MNAPMQAGSGDDLSAVAWVQGELRRSLEAAHKALRRYQKEAEALGGSDVDAADPAVLRSARAQLHQGVGALELVGLPEAAQLLRASEAAVQRMLTKPAIVDARAIDTIERASFALLDYLTRLLAGKPVSPVALFPQYRAAQTLAGAERVHPADLWAQDFAWHELPSEPGVLPRSADDDARSALESLVLAAMRQPDLVTLARTSDLCAELAAGTTPPQTTLWQLAAAFFEAQAQGLLAGDVYSKRIASRLLSQLRSTVRGEEDAVSDRLGQDLLFFCAHARAATAATAPRLAAVRAAWQLGDGAVADYETPRLGRFDPAWVAQAKKRVAGAKDAWSAVAGGELHRLTGLSEQFQLVGESLHKLFPAGESLATALQTAVNQTVAAGAEPAPALAMEVATALLYVDACIEDGDLEHEELAGRVQRLARRIDDLRIGAEPHPLESWMEELYRRVSDRQTMGSVVQELRASLSEVEKQIDQYFRDPTQRGLLIPVPGQLSAMRGVLSVLGMDQASQAVLRMRDDVDALAQTEVDPQRAVQTGTFDHLADNLGALSFLIDMLSVQPALAKSLFRFDPATGMLSAVMGQSERNSAFAAFDDAPADTAGAPVVEAPLSAPMAFDEMPATVAMPRPPAPAAAAASGLEDDAEMREIFIEEAREVVENARASLDKLSDQPDDIGEMTAVRRAFHTLKGSARMVGLKAFGEAGWACEQLFNARLAQSSRMDQPLRAFTAEALDYLGAWTEAIAAGRDEGHVAAAVSRAADALRLEGRRVPIGTQADSVEPEAPVEAVAVGEVSEFGDLDALPEPEPEPEPESTTEPDTVEAAALPEVIETDDALTADAGLPEPFDEPALDVQAEPPPLLDRVPDLPSAADLDLGLPPLPEGAAEPVDATPAGDEPSFELDLGDDALSEPAAPVAPEAEPQAEGEAGEPPDAAVVPVASAETVELDLAEFDLDFGEPASDAPAAEPSPAPADALDAVEPPAVSDAPDAPDALDVPDLSDEPAADAIEPGFDLPAPQPEPEPEAEPVDALAEAPAASDATPEPELSPADDEPVKLIGPLRISIPLFNIFLNEADEQSRRLGTELAEWGLEFDRHPVAESAIALAHSLAGNSATVGYTDLSSLARALEHALERSRHWGHGRRGEPALFSEAAEEIRRLLHQFAAGFLRPVAPDLMEQLAEHERWPSEPTPSLLGEFTSVPMPHAAPRDAELDDDEIDVEDAIDAELFPIFEEEADELVPQLLGRLRDWVDRPGDDGAPAACMRTLHTFKGGARLAGAMRVGEMAHRLETAIEHLAALGPIEAHAIEPLLARADAMVAAFEELRAAPPPAADSPAVPVADVAPADSPAPVEDGAETDAATTPQIAETAEPADAAPDAAPADVVAAAPAAVSAPMPVPIDWSRFSTAPAQPVQAADRPQPAVSAAVRVRGALLDRMVNQAGEVSITRARIDADVRQLQASLNELTDSLDRMRKQLRDLELQAETQINTRMEAAKAASEAFDPLEMDRFTRFQELTRFLAESVNDVATLQRSLQRTLQSTEDELAAQARLTRELQDDLLRTRMIEFESLADRLYRVVRQAAKDSGKQVRLDITGGAIEIDRGVLDRMTGPFEHLLRNCVAHGIELPAARAAAGKDAVGSIAISITQEGNEVGVDVRDDGAGLDLVRIRERAVERGLIAADAVLSDAELGQLIFEPGFSTAQSITELAGRGVGLDVVRAEVDAMGGRIQTASAPGQGTGFRLLLPLTTAVTQVVMLRCGELSVAVPSTLVEVVRRVPADEIEQAYAGGEYVFGDERVPFFWLAALLQAGTRGGTGARTQPVVVIRSAAQRVALHVDEVVGNQEVVVKNVGPQLSHLPGLAGVTLLPSGAVALIYNPVALATRYGGIARERMLEAPRPAIAEAAPLPVAEARAPLVLVVDDSLTVRRVTQRLLVREGYRVTTAKDGLDAIERLAEERPAVMLSDIEMPRMDGFDLLRNVRAEPATATLPVIMITSRIAQKHRDYATELGVDHYLGKPYAEDELLALVARYAGADIPT